MICTLFQDQHYYIGHFTFQGNICFNTACKTIWARIKKLLQTALLKYGYPEDKDYQGIFYLATALLKQLQR